MNESTISAEVFESLLLEGKRIQITDEAAEFSTRTLVWLALPPFWQLSLASQGFPKKEGELVTGDEVRSLLDSAVQSRFAERENVSGTDGDISYWMTTLQRRHLIDQIVSGELSTGDFGGLAYLQKEMAEIGQRLLHLSEKTEIPPGLRRWASLAERANNLYDLSDFFDNKIKEALPAEGDPVQTAAPEVLRWLEAFTPFVEIYGSSLEVSLTSARRKYEIFNRQAYDQRYLTSYLERNEQDAAFLKLLGQPDGEDQPWALHYVGAGGVGKTMLMRHINAHLSPKYNLAIARIDFDYLNPDYPAKQPGLLLLGFAVELKKYLVGSQGFLRFERQILEIHQSLRSDDSANEFVNVRSEPWIYIISSFADECRRLLELGMKPLLILDTCEELVKLRPDGELPESVRVTFDILEEIHRQLPSVRVIFSGRRPLARIGYNWRLSDNDVYLNKLPERDYLMLHEIRGFNYTEAVAFLNNYNGKIPEALFEAIIARSSHVLKNDARTFLFDGDRNEPGDDVRATTGRDSRYNPFDLDLYADWVASEPGIDEAKLIAGAHFYVKERIVGRVNPDLKKLLPALLLLGRFDEAMLRELYGEDKNDFKRLFEELIDQEWIDTERSVTILEATTQENDIFNEGKSRGLSVWAIDPNMRERLLAYYRVERLTELSAARERIAPFLSRITLERDWQDLSIPYFEAAAQVLTGLDTESAADWWEQVEAKLIETARWDWAYALTSQLLADGGIAELKEAKASRGGTVPEENDEAESVLRPAILATYAAALVHIKPQDLRSVWQEVKEKAHLHPTNAGRFLLSKRAVLGLLAGAAADPKTTGEAFEKLTGELKHELLNDELPENDLARASQLQASIIGVIEKIVERYEQSGDYPQNFPRWFSPRQDEFAWTRNLPDQLSDYYDILKARIPTLTSESSSTAAASDFASEPGNSEYKQKWLDWRAPDNFDARRKLEYLRLAYPLWQSPEQALEKVGDPPANLSTVDDERLASAVLTLKGHAGLDPDADIDEKKIEDSLSIAKKISAHSELFNEAFLVNAHRAFPPYFIAALEARAMRGELSATIERAVSILQEAERGNDSITRREIERLLARLAFYFRLRDERSVSFGESLTASKELEDVRLRSMLDSLDGGILEQNYWLELVTKADKIKQAALLHFRYRSSAKLLNPKTIEKAKANDKEKSEPGFVFSGESLPAANIFKSFITFDEVEYNLRKENKTSLRESRLSELKNLESKDFVFQTLVASFNEELSQKGDGAIESINFSGFQSAEKYPSEESVKLIGKRRAAAIMLEEGMLLAIRNPKAVQSTLRRAAKLYKECNDACGQFLTALTNALLAIRINEITHLRKAWTDLERVYPVMVERNPGLPSWADIAACFISAKKSSNPTRIFTDFFDRYADNLYWRPILARLVFCLVRVREFDGEEDLTLIFKTWLQVNYARAAGGDQPLLPSEFYFKQVKTGPAHPSDYRGTFLKYFKKALLIAVIAGYFYLVGSNSYLLLISLVMAGGLLLVWWQRRFKLKLLIDTPQAPPNPNLPLGVSHTVNWQTDKIFRWLPGILFKQTSPLDQSRESSYSMLPSIFNKLLRNFLTFTKIRIGPLATTIIFENAGSVAAPWEAALSVSKKGFHNGGLMFRRMLQKAYSPRTGEMRAPIGISLWASDNAMLNAVYQGWLPLTRLPNFQYSGFTPANIKKAENNKNVCVLHLVGLPIETPSGLCLEIVSSETESQELNTASVLPEERIINIRKINQEFPNLRVCIVQLPPRSEETRSLTNRVEIAKLRRFCADVFQSGIGAVILLPAVNPELNVECVRKISEFIVRTDKEQTEAERETRSREATVRQLEDMIGRLSAYFILSFLCFFWVLVLLLMLVGVLYAIKLAITLPWFTRATERKRNTGPEKWMRIVHEIEKLVAEKGHSDREAASEMAYDVCLYLHDEFTWRIHKA